MLIMAVIRISQSMVLLKFGENWTINMGDYGKKSISPVLVVVVLVLQFESQYLKNRKSEILHTCRVRCPDVQ